ncbi:MAG TPA: hypothetical protein VD995_18945 [Azospirillum sp.]|nr:hypothetical protein [Azospirillum sp.]
MPRAPHPDLEPEIWLPADWSEQQSRAKNAVGQNWSARAYHSNNGFRGTYSIVFDDLHDQVGYLRKIGVKIDEGLLFFMTRKCDIAKSVPARKVKKIHSGGMDHEIHILKRVGCRVRETQDEIATEYRCSREHVNRQISLLEYCLIIANKRRRWFEFDADYVWRGAGYLRNEYSKIQRRSDIEIMQHGVLVSRMSGYPRWDATPMEQERERENDDEEWTKIYA